MRNETKILKPRKLKSIVLLLASCLFVISGFYIVEEDILMGWVGIIFFGLGVIVFIIKLLPGSTYLKLTQEGFEVQNLFKSEFTKWSDVKIFSIGSIPIYIFGDIFYIWKRKMVMLDYEKSHKKYRRGKEISNAISGHHGALPDTYGLSYEELVELMNEWKLKN